MSDDLTIIYSAANAQQAAILKGILSDEGIETQVTNVSLQGAAGELPVGFATAPSVLARQEDAERARGIALEFEKDIAEGNTPPLFAQGAIESFWPRCPECNLKREPVCAHCGVSDPEMQTAEFMVSEVADHETGVGPASSFQLSAAHGQFMCSVCDEAFDAQYLRHCGGCKHEFDDGVEPHQDEPHETNPRAIATIIGLVAIGLFSFLYYFFVLKP